MTCFVNCIGSAGCRYYNRLFDVVLRSACYCVCVHIHRHPENFATNMLCHVTRTHLKVIKLVTTSYFHNCILIYLPSYFRNIVLELHNNISFRNLIQLQITGHFTCATYMQNCARITNQSRKHKQLLIKINNNLCLLLFQSNRYKYNQ